MIVIDDFFLERLSKGCQNTVRVSSAFMLRVKKVSKISTFSCIMGWSGIDLSVLSPKPLVVGSSPTALANKKRNFLSTKSFFFCLSKHKKVRDGQGPEPIRAPGFFFYNCTPCILEKANRSVSSLDLRRSRRSEASFHYKADISSRAARRRRRHRKQADSIMRQTWSFDAAVSGTAAVYIASTVCF